MTIEELFAKMTEIGLEGWISLEEGRFISEMAAQIPEGGNYLEVGVAFGKSLSIVATYAKPNVGIFGIDRLNWDQRDRNMEKLGTKARTNFIEGDSQEIAKEFDRPLDLLFIDGDHTYWGVVKDLLSWLPHVKSGGRIMMHDYANNAPGVQRAIHEFVFPHQAYKDFTTNVSIYSFIKK